jgi:hypothetical protein
MLNEPLSKNQESQNIIKQKKIIFEQSGYLLLVEELKFLEDSRETYDSNPRLFRDQDVVR